MEKKYIQPSIINYSLFRTLLDEKATLRYFGISKGAELSLNDISSKKSTRTFVIAEPGFGKTRLLKEIISYASVISKEGIFIELKKILPNRAIDAYIQDNLAVLFKSKKFILKNSKQLVVCLDALDEVKSYDFSAIVELIEVFSKKYFNISLFVSCRYHHFSKYQNLFDTFQFDFLQIQPFTREQVKSYLNNSNISDQDVEQMIRILTSRGRDLIIQTPRYLEMIANFIGKEGAEVVSNLTKGELFEKFIYQKLDLENRKSKNNESELIKRVLEKIALVMEIYQTNTLKKDDLITIFEDVKSNLNISFLHQVPIKDFLDRTVIKDNIDEIEFENTEFQEFLAAKEILRLGRSDQVVFDLAVDQELNEIFPSWFNTLSFLIDLNIDLINPIFEFTNNRLSDLQDEAYHRFLTRVHVERLKLEERKRIFEDVFSYYQKAMNWIPYDVAENLSFYFDISQNIILKKAIVEAESEPNYFVKNGNVAFIIAFLIEKEIFNDSQLKYWEEKLTQFAKDANTNGVLQRQTLFALGKLKNIELLKKVVHLRTSSDDLILQEFMEACAEINPNDKFSIDSFVIGCKRREIYARYGIYQITERKGLKQLLDYFVSDDKFLDMFFDQESIFKEKDKKLIENIKNRFDKNIQKSCENVILKAFSNHRHFYFSEKSVFIKGIVSLLKENDAEYIFRLIKAIGKNEELKKFIFYFNDVFALILQKGQVESFIKHIQKISPYERVATDILFRIGESSRIDSKDIFEEGRQYFKTEYQKKERSIKKQKRIITEEERIYKEFKDKLEPADNEYMQDVFRFYNQHKKEIDLKITDSDMKRLKELICKSIFDKFDPGKQKLTMSKRGAQSCTYTTHPWIHVFGDCLITAKYLNIKVEKYIEKILAYIPFAYSEHVQAIFTLIPSLKKKEVSKIVNAYKQKRRDDLAYFHTENFVDVAKKYTIEGSIPVLKSFVEKKEFHLHVKRSSLEAIAIIKPNQVYFKKIFAKYHNSVGGELCLAEIANAFLISVFQDDEAIKWRMNQLKNRVIPIVKSKGVRCVSGIEKEFRHKDFAEPLMKLVNPKYKKNFFELLKTSFQIVKQGEEYWSYSTYLRDIVVAYFDNLKITKSYSHIKELEKYVQGEGSADGVNWFKGCVQDLKHKYMQYLGKPKSISECIKKYNHLKEQQYLDIATSRDLHQMLVKIFDEDIRRFVEDEGFYRVVEKYSKSGEELIQKTLKTQIAYALVNKGFRGFDIRREDQLLDNKRIDFLVSYGLIGPILVEVKRTDNKEVIGIKERKEYKKKLLQYISGSHSCSGIFIVFQIKEKYPVSKYLPKLQKMYHQENIDFIGLNCLLKSNNE